MTLALFSHPACARHETGAGHPERPERLAAVSRGLAAVPGAAAVATTEAPPATRAWLERVHSPAHVERVHAFAPQQGLIHWDADTPMGPHSLAAALRAAGAGVAAVDAVLGGAATAAFCNVRPPGHHATRNQAMGFCLFNNIAVAAAHALAAHGLARVAIADFDVHHGNGTEDIFAGDDRVLLLSSFQADIYPHPGPPTADNIVHTPIPGGAPATVFRDRVERDWFERLATFAPQLLLISAGFDAHATETLAALRLHAEDYAWVTERLLATVADSAAGRVVSMLEGGYQLPALTECVAAHVGALSPR